MFKNQKHAFWQAFILTLAIFVLGIVFGVVLENWRTSKISDLSKQSEVDLLDIRLQNEIYNDGYFNCDLAVEKNIDFANKIYEEAKILDRYETASRITEDLMLEHKKYDILRAMLLTNSVKIKQKCNASYHEVVYFYNYEEKSLEVRAKQNVFSKLLTEIKERTGNEILLVPIAGNIGATSIELLMDNYNITKEELPVILIDRKIKIHELENIEDLMPYFE